MNMYRCLSALLVALFLYGNAAVPAQEPPARGEKIRSGYAKFEQMIPMRDGVHLYTAIYVPYSMDRTAKYPILMVRTPYSAGPYGANEYRSSLGPSEAYEDEQFIFVYQDVRGRYMSEGEFVNMRPHIPSKQQGQIDESSDTYDTIEWLINNVQQNNGRVGQWGISYPGFYSSAGCIDSHPALKAVSPQAPIADWFFDDFHRNGAFVLPMAFNFFSSFGKSRPQPLPYSEPGYQHTTKDGYQFFLDLGPLGNVNKRFFNESISFWNDLTQHPNYDEFWQSRNLIPHLKNISASVLVVGGWFDTEDLYGPLATYRSIEEKNPNIQNTLVMGPWYHGQWNRNPGEMLGDASFDFATAERYRDEVEYPFFVQTLKGDGPPNLPEAFVFETGANRWRSFDAWPPTSATPLTMRLAAGGQLHTDDAPPASRLSPQTDCPVTDALAPEEGSTPWISDPAKPVPYTEEITTRWARDYVTEDQRFAARRPDVLVFRGPVLEEDLTIAGPINAKMFFATTGQAADLVVKVIDEYPGVPPGTRPGAEIPDTYPSGRQQLVRAGVLRTRFRNSFEHPEPLVPNEITEINVPLRDIHHTFLKGHRVMLQVQSSWFPFIDRNPQTWVPNIFEAKDEDFQLQIHRIFHDASHTSRLEMLKM
jgi:putative CocE/NonD family hydrolase